MTSNGFVPRQTNAILAIGVVSGCIPALQPILLGGLLAEQRLSAAQIGQAATIESIAMAASAALASAFLKPIRLRSIAVGAILCMTAANAVTAAAASGIVLAARGASGAAAGVLLWLLVGMLTRAERPGRLFAIYVTLQAAGAFCLSVLLSGWLIPAGGIMAGYGGIACVNALLLLVVPVMPRRYSEPSASTGGRWPTSRGAVGLLAIVSYLGGVMAVWVYLVPLGAQLGYRPATVAFAVSVAIGVQILGALTAGACTDRLSGAAANILSAVASIAALLLLLNGSGDAIFYGAVAVFAFFWMFAPPFHLPMLIAFDPSRRTAMFVGSAQLVGLSVGPVIAAATVEGNAVAGALWVSLGLFGFSAVVSLLGGSLPARDRPLVTPDRATAG